jgi:hypothetical protein
MTRLIHATLALCLLAVTAFAQSNTGRLVGSVSDPSGVIPGANVVVKDNATGREQTVVASGDGGFTVPQLNVGTYTVTITADGHKTFVANDVKIDVGRDYTLNATLEVGQITESITVTAGADVLNASNAELSNTVSPRQIQELPLNGRDPTALVTLQAGTASNGATNTSINGQRTSFTNITRDGINIQDNFIRANASDFSVQRPTTDNVSEFTITTQNASADQGYGASQVQFVTPRGQNEFHGAGYLYNRNSRFAANEFFNNSSGVAKPFLNRNQYGFRLSGPVWKNKIFFFGNYEGFRLRTQEPSLRTILTPTARTGLFTYNRADNGALQTVNLFSPAFLNLANFGLVGAERVTGIDPTVQSRIIANLPTAGNSTARGDQLNTTGFAFNQRSNFDQDTYVTRIDYDINSKNTISGVWSFTDERVVDRPDVDDPSGFGTAPVVNQPSNRRFLSVAWRTSPTSNFTNEFRGGYFLSDPTFLRTTPQVPFAIGDALGQLPLINNPEVIFENQGRDSNTYSLQDTADYIRGNHGLRFGGSVQFFRIVNFAGFDTIPRYTLGTSTTSPSFIASDFPGGIGTAQLGTANGLLGLLGGIVIQADQAFNATNRTSGYVAGAPGGNTLDFEQYGFFIADQWRVSPRLTLNLGLRYDIYTALRERNGFALEPVIQSGRTQIESLLDPNGTVDFIGVNGNGNKFYKTDFNNFGPVLGFAWSPQFKNKFLGSLFGDGRTVIRGGFRISYVNDEFVRGTDNAQGGNEGLSSFPALTELNARLNALPTIPTPAFQIPRTYADANNLTGFSTVFGIDPNLQIPRTMEYNFGIQREIGFQTAIEVRYVGGRSDNLVRGTDFNQVNIFDNGFVADFNRARANLIQFGNPACSAAQAAATGCQQLTIFPQLALGGLLSNGTIRNSLRAGTVADLAILYQQNGFAPGNLFLTNFNAGPVDVLSNSGRYRYNSLQVELRRRFADGLYFQANYTFQKTLTDASGVNQSRFEPNLANQAPELEYSRADYDQAHVFNFNGIYELPFGKGKRFLNEGSWLNRLVGGWQVGGILRVATGAPLTITDPRGTFNRVGRSGRQTPQTSLTTDQIKNLIGVFRTPCGVYFINPSVININTTTCVGTGRAAEGFGSTPFAGQVFFNNAPGQTGSLERAFINGPLYAQLDASLIKNIQLTERVRFQIRAEMFNVLNRANFAVGFTQAPTQFTIFNINSTNFGKFTETFDPRIIQFAGRLEF